jgi:hypothetical protein
MVDLSEFRTDTKAINDGVWLRVNEAAYGDLEILSRGFTDDFVDAQNARIAKAAEPYGNDRTRVPNSLMRQINASLLEDYLVLDVRNLKNGEADVEVGAFHMMLYDAAFNRLSRACWDAASRVTTRSEAQLKSAVGNLPPRSEPGLNGAI